MTVWPVGFRYSQIASLVFAIILNNQQCCHEGTSFERSITCSCGMGMKLKISLASALTLSMSITLTLSRKSQEILKNSIIALPWNSKLIVAMEILIYAALELLFPSYCLSSCFAKRQHGGADQRNSLRGFP